MHSENGIKKKVKKPFISDWVILLLFGPHKASRLLLVGLLCFGSEIMKMCSDNGIEKKVSQTWFMNIYFGELQPVYFGMFFNMMDICIKKKI